MLGVVKLVVPLPPVSTVPPLAAEYQSMVEPDGTLVTLMSTVPVPQRSPSTAVARPGRAFRVIVPEMVAAVQGD